MIGGTGNDPVSVFLPRQKDPRPAGDVAWQVGFGKVRVVRPGLVDQVPVIVFPVAVVIFVMIGELDVSAFRVGDADPLAASYALPGPLINGPKKFLRQGMGRGG